VRRRTWTRAAWAAELMPHATIFRPDGPGPFPLVIQMHGCVGPRPFERIYAEAARDAGLATLMIDSFRPRGLSRLAGSALVCTGAILRGAERAADLIATHHWAEGQSWVDPGRIAAAGWSHGAWSIMDALAAGPDAARFSGLADLPERPLARLAAAVLVYPYAGYPALTAARGWGDHRPPVAALLCGKDQVVGVRHPARAIDRLERDGVPVDRLFFADATHAFDDEGAAHPQARFRPDLLEQAKHWYVQALTRALT
jgi:dienelactone hydrolase